MTIHSHKRNVLFSSAIKWFVFFWYLLILPVINISFCQRLRDFIISLDYEHSWKSLHMAASHNLQIFIFYYCWIAMNCCLVYIIKSRRHREFSLSTLSVKKARMFIPTPREFNTEQKKIDGETKHPRLVWTAVSCMMFFWLPGVIWEKEVSQELVKPVSFV